MIPCIILSFTYDTNIPLYLIHERDKKYSAALYDASAFTFYRVRSAEGGGWNKLRTQLVSLFSKASAAPADGRCAAAGALARVVTGGYPPRYASSRPYHDHRRLL